MVQTQLDQLAKVQNDMLVNASRDKHAYGIRTRSGAATQDPLYPEGHPKRIEQDSQQGEDSGSPRKRKKNKHKKVEEPLEPAVDPNSIFVSDAETESGYKNESPDKEEGEEELLMILKCFVNTFKWFKPNLINLLRYKKIC